ncbi:MAG: helix-turn-helix domain-containing protein [Actinomycetota bacterium]|nr:helix-turn-helix domain-containing protein [Actinomycetota bacterium]
MGRPGYSPEFRRKVLDLLAEGRSVASIAHDLDTSDQTIYNWSPPGPYRPRPSGGSNHRGERRVGGGHEAHRRAGDRTGGHSSCG